DAYLASAPDYLEFQFVEDWQNASTDQARKRVIADQVSSLTDQSAFARHKQFEEPKRSKSREPRI
ncbi:MAG: hypothetical protein KF844_09060, partial [Cryobacterium sp.]|nr:hypothetical protein [Cryobacterium sp.]